MLSGSHVLNKDCALHLLGRHKARSRRHALKRTDVYLLQVHVLPITQVARLYLQCGKREQPGGETQHRPSRNQQSLSCGTCDRRTCTCTLRWGRTLSAVACTRITGRSNGEVRPVALTSCCC